MYRRLPQLEIPTSYTDAAMSVIDQCKTASECTLSCQRYKYYCEAVIYDSEDKTCELHASALLNYTSATSPNNLTYYESLCAFTSPVRPNDCPDVNELGLKDCQEIYQRGFRQPGLYNIRNPDPNQYGCLAVWCDFDAESGWTVIQRRENGDVDFSRTWADYYYGFGNYSGDYWFGNLYIHELTDIASSKLNIVMRSWEGVEVVANYSQFSVGNYAERYKLTVSGYTGNAGDALANHTGLAFSTKDKTFPNNCSQTFEAGWWYAAGGECFKCNLNGRLANSSYSDEYNAVWEGGNFTFSTALKYIVMRVSRDG
ncbi:TNC [Bugula neritina]|uniref:TNC n=1 Tax=Bugula neritina TaxID=10212 RepID=A0A7J7ISS0_BUGNE|nr:TNC [Bugula neritina]